MGWQYIGTTTKGEYLRYRAAFGELKEWASSKAEWAGDWVSRLDDISLIDDGITYWDSFPPAFDSLPLDREISLFSIDIPWFFRVPVEVMEKARELCEKWGAGEIWWDIIKEGSAAEADTMGSFAKMAKAHGWKLEKNTKNGLIEY